MPDLTIVINSACVCAVLNGELCVSTIRAVKLKSSLLQSTHLEHQATQRPNIRLCVVAVLGQDLWRHVQRGLKSVMKYYTGKGPTPTYVLVKAELPISLLKPKSPNLTKSSERNTAHEPQPSGQSRMDLTVLWLQISMQNLVSG